MAGDFESFIVLCRDSLTSIPLNHEAEVLECPALLARKQRGFAPRELPQEIVELCRRSIIPAAGFSSRK